MPGYDGDRQGRYDGFPGADIALEQTVHRMPGGKIGLHVREGILLGGGQLERQSGDLLL